MSLASFNGHVLFDIPASMGRGKSTLGGMARSNRIIRLRGYGNAIVPELAAEFIRAYLGDE